MTDEQKIVKMYKDMYAAMIAKDTDTLRRMHDESFVLVHMTGMRQTREEYISAIVGGTLNYYSAEHEEARFAVTGDTARLTGKSKVNAAVFGGGRHTWNLQLSFELERKNGEWYFTHCAASTY